MEPIVYLIAGISTIFGATAMFCGMKILEHYKNKEAKLRAELDAIEEQLQQVWNALIDAQEQVEGKQLPFFIRDGLEDIKSLENKDSFDLARLRLYLEEGIKTVDQAAERQSRMADIYSRLRNHKKIN